MKHLYFAYGANTNLECMSIRCVTARVLGPAEIFGYKLVFKRHADIELSKDHSVKGVLWLLEDQDLESLDQFEGFPQYYLRRRVWVKHSNEEKIAWVYQMKDQLNLMEPSNAYYQLCKEGYQQNNINYCQLDEAKDQAKRLSNR
jgi:gamma-glutamylcyclotransferase (GGCT)/AIG2-like uncharacterized protein YtfP